MDIETNSEITFKNKNFIFGKNGSEKLILIALISEQYKYENNIRIFTDIESFIIHNKINAAVLGEGNSAI